MNTIHTSDIFGSRSRVAVLGVLVNVSVPLSIRQVAVQAGLSHASAGEALDHLVSLGVVAASDAGRSRIHWLERRNLAVRQMVLPVFEAEAAAAQAAIEALVAALPSTVYSAVLFGSRARGENALDSDYDVVVVEPNRSNLERALASIDLASTDLRATLGAPVSVLGYTIDQALELVTRGDNFMGGVVREGISLVGMPPESWGKPRQP
jgi:predicted nucleotidyltransferase